MRRGEAFFPPHTTACRGLEGLVACIYGLHLVVCAGPVRATRSVPIPGHTCDSYPSLLVGCISKARAVDIMMASGCVMFALFGSLTRWDLADGDDMLASASGDQTIRVWDMQPDRPEVAATLRGHKGSVKSVQFRPQSRCELVSGARGGDIILWDTRVGQGAVTTLSVQVSPHPPPTPPPLQHTLPLAHCPREDMLAFCVCAAANRMRQAAWHSICFLCGDVFVGCFVERLGCVLGVERVSARATPANNAAMCINASSSLPSLVCRLV